MLHWIFAFEADNCIKVFILLLQLIIRWTFVEGVSLQFEAVKKGFEMVFPLSNLKLFYPEEVGHPCIELVFCCILKNWNIMTKGRLRICQSIWKLDLDQKSWKKCRSRPMNMCGRSSMTLHAPTTSPTTWCGNTMASLRSSPLELVF